MIIVADAQGRTDGPAFQMLSQVDSRIAIVLMSRTPRYNFNEELLNLDKYVLFEYSEMGWDWNFTNTHEWGKNTDQFPQFADEEYKRFDDWVASNPPLLTFTREILKKDVTETHFAIDYPCWQTVPELVSKESFEGRPISFFHFFGRSHEGRLKAHADTWYNTGKYGYSVCDNIYHYEKFMLNEKGRKAVSLWQPHYYRHDISVMMQIGSMAKISFALAGAGRKTFRHLESSSNSAMLMWQDEMKWAYDWIDGYNCIVSKEGEEIKTIFERLDHSSLYDVYCRGAETCRKYEVNRYIKEYIEPIIHGSI